MNFQSLESVWRPADAFSLDLIWYLTRVGRGERPKYNLLSPAASADLGLSFCHKGFTDTETKHIIMYLFV